jgi:hypothetical protein
MAKSRALAKATAGTKKGVANRKGRIKSEEKLQGDSGSEAGGAGESQDGEADMTDEEKSA